MIHTVQQKEIEVLFNEIFLPILEMRHATLRQKSLLLSIYQRLCQDPQALVEIYINYDCDRTALENIYERLVNVIARIGQTQFAPLSKAEEAAQAQDSKQAGSAAGLGVPQSLNIVSADAAVQSRYAHLSPDQRLKRQSLECLVAVLRSLVIWGTATTKSAQEDHMRSVEDVSHIGSANGDGPEPRQSLSLQSGVQTPDVQADDDVERFETAKQKKNTLLEGIRKFNFKPKRVRNRVKWLTVTANLAILGPAIPDRQWLCQERQARRHCSLSAESGRAEQGDDWRVSRRGVCPGLAFREGDAILMRPTHLIATRSTSPPCTHS